MALQHTSEEAGKSEDVTTRGDMEVYKRYLSRRRFAVDCTISRRCPVGWLVYSCCSHLEHGASVKRIVSLQSLNLRHSLELLDE
jgi:hypothetical protein